MRDEGLTAAQAARRYGLAVGTVRSWERRAPKPHDDAEDEPDDDGDDFVDPTSLDRVEYLGWKVAEQERLIKTMWAERQFSSIAAAYALQSKFHQERVDLIRAEGSRLDLTSDPVVLARQIDAARELLQTLLVDLDEPATVVATVADDAAPPDIGSEGEE